MFKFWYNLDFKIFKIRFQFLMKTFINLTISNLRFCFKIFNILLFFQEKFYYFNDFHFNSDIIGISNIWYLYCYEFSY